MLYNIYIPGDGGYRPCYRCSFSSVREQTIKDLKNKEIKNWKFFFFIAGRYGKTKLNLDFLRIFDQFLILCDFNQST